MFDGIVKRMKWRFGIVLILLVVVALLVVQSEIDMRERTARFVEWLQSQGTLGLVWLGLAYIPASVFVFPASLLTLAGGFAFGVAMTVVAVSLGSTVGATAAFLAGRTFLRRFIEHKVSSDVVFRSLDAAVAEQGFKIVMLTRFSPILPFGLLNYAFGLTKVRVRDFILASWIGMFPGTVLYVSIGSAAKSLSDIAAGRSEGGIAQKVFFAVGLLATLAVTIVINRIARKALKDASVDA
ncbi:MAG: TVP38/TMEM64 family protein [Planctomycetes bacterium]|nr:TVP38/TMEM64 family protein [Planctomycetota bacterium]